MNTKNTRDDLREWIVNLINNSDHPLSKNEIAKQLKLKGSDRMALKEILRDLQSEGDLIKGRRRKLVSSTQPKLGKGLIAAEVIDIDEDGHLIAAPLEWPKDQMPPKMRIIEMRRSHAEGRSALAVTSRIIVKVITKTETEWHVSVVRRLVKDAKKHLGIFQANRRGGYIASINRKDVFPGVHVTAEDAQGLEAGDIVQYTVDHGNQFHFIKVLGKFDDPKMFSEIAIHNHGIPYEFSPEAIAIAEEGKVPPLGNRTDFRSIPLVTIDGEDARDFDDAVWAEPDTDERNQGGWRAIVAIADVSYYVRSGSALDSEAQARGNSVYFPDRVVPMLPEALSNNLCSLRPHEDRACMAIEMIISAHGKIKSFRVKRGLMRSQARLTYNQVQAAIDGQPDSVTHPLMETVIRPLYGVYKSLLKARSQRGTVELDMPERQIMFDENGRMVDVKIRERHDSHKIIEELMIAANVCAAKTLIAKKWPCMFRVHDKPDPMRVANLRQFLKQFKLNLSKSAEPTPAHYNEILQQVKERPYFRTVSELVLRSMAQAQYSPNNLGHFGLSLFQYAHFTSPIRRYADLIVHRCLIAALELGEGGYEEKPDDLQELGQHISDTERRAATAEREVVDRYTISFVASRIGQEFEVTIVGVNRHGLFVEIEASGAEGFVSMRSLDWDFFTFDEANYRLVGRRTKSVYQLGQKVKAVVIDAEVQTNSLSFRVVPEVPTKADKKGSRQQAARKKRRE
ncbi:ribonuclease R [Candidatus Odyssella thessalonicensis]|uniref:ribonuclease R n=1 Tax=Candidatus Odyssella thessalonicensis TaxID=84647 RepID=UPI000225AE99|nr:ribonuclease R [Candidatus Odyssella thessalonicensis]